MINPFGRKRINRGRYLKDQIRGMLGSVIYLVMFFAGMGLSIMIMSINDNFTKSILLIIHVAIHLIIMILVVIFTFIDEKRMKKKGRCIWITESGKIMIWSFAGDTLVLALVYEALFMSVNIGAALDFLGRI